MKNNSKTTTRSFPSMGGSSAKNAGSAPAGLFLGYKALHELRILMRLASSTGARPIVR